MIKALKNLFKRKPAHVSDRAAYLAEQELLDTPWAVFEITGFETDGRVKVEFAWNSTFITKIRELGFHAETEDDSVQLFFYASQMRPSDLSGGDQPSQSDQHPQLSGAQNVLRT